MKYTISFILTTIILYSYSQNIIPNPSFENCDLTANSGNFCANSPGTITCSTVPNYVSQFHYVADWKFSCSPDWYADLPSHYDNPTTVGTPPPGDCGTQVIDAKDGSYYVGLYNYEIIAADLGSNLAEGFYSVSFWVHSCRAAWKIKVFGSNEVPGMGTQDDLCTPTAEKLYTLHEQTFTQTNDWQLVTVDFSTTAKDIRYFCITGDRHGTNCSQVDYFFVDGFEMSYEACCPPYELFQHSHLHTSTTERRDFIKAGTDVGAGPPLGPVTVEPNEFVIFRAGNYISLEPGFSTLGGTFLAVIGPCSQTEGGEISVDYIDAEFTPNGNGIHDEWCLHQVGATYYYIDVIDRYGAVHTYQGPIYNSWLCLPINFNDICDEALPVYIHLENCSDEWNMQGTTFAACTGVSEKKEVDLSEKLNELPTFDIFPNPNNGSFTVNARFNDEKRIEAILYDIHGQIVKQLTAGLFHSLFYQTFDISNLSKGPYLIDCKVDGVSNRKLIIKN